MIPLWGFHRPNANPWAPLLTGSRRLGRSLWRIGDAMSQWFAVLRTRGPNWDHTTPLRRQKLWDEHATFMDGLQAEGLIRLAGLLDGSIDVLMIASGESAEAIE